jgi:hypothetical protein
VFLCNVLHTFTALIIKNNIMKKISILFIALVATIATVNAQYFVEGSVSMSYSDSENTSAGGLTNSGSYFGVGISPKIGYWLSDNFAIGASVHASVINRKNTNSASQESKDNYQRFGASVFSLHKMLSAGKFVLLLENSIGISETKDNNFYTSDDKSILTFGISTVPALVYDISEKISLVTTCNFLSLNLSHSTTKYKDSDRKQTSNNFDVGANSTVFNSLGYISIGFAYKF